MKPLTSALVACLSIACPSAIAGGSGLRGYRKLARRSSELVESEGFLFLASCSHNVTVEAFYAEVRNGMARAGRTGRVLRLAGAGPDHPVHPHLPESGYLKAVLLQLD